MPDSDDREQLVVKSTKPLIVTDVMVTAISQIFGMSKKTVRELVVDADEVTITVTYPRQ